MPFFINNIFLFPVKLIQKLSTHNSESSPTPTTTTTGEDDTSTDTADNEYNDSLNNVKEGEDLVGDHMTYVEVHGLFMISKVNIIL